MSPDLSKFYWENHDWSYFKTIDPSKTLAVLPISATEQHGPHLPLGTDRFINDAIVEKALETLPNNFPCLILPHQSIARSIEHSGYAGTLTYSTETTMAAWKDIARSVHKSGIRKLLFFNSHGGNVDLMHVIGRDLRIELDMIVSGVSWFDFGYPENLFDKQEIDYGWHGGNVETSMMLAIDSDTVDMKKAANFENSQKSLPRPIGRLYWKTEDVNEAGVTGNAALAMKDTGEILLSYFASHLSETIKNLSAL